MKARKNLLIAPASHLQVAEKQIARLLPDCSFASTTCEAFVAEAESGLVSKLTSFRRYERTAYFAPSLDRGGVTIWQAAVWWLGQNGFLFDAAGRCVNASFTAVLRDAVHGFGELVSLPYLFSRVASDLRVVRTRRTPRLREPLSVAYVRTDYWFGNKVGGSVGHVAGVANAFSELGASVCFLSSDTLELVDEHRTPVVRVDPPRWMRVLPETPLIAYNREFIAAGNRAFAQGLPNLIYQRASLFSYAGAYLAAQWNVPLIVEYNASEVWAAKHWGLPLRYARWADYIETSVLQAGHAIVVVSEPLRKELISRGIDERKILVNPNGVDTDRFDPGILESKRDQVRTRFKLNGKVVVGFIGTFGPWHGATVLARAIKPVVERCPEIHFLLIGDGKTLPETRGIIEKTGIQSHVTFTGRVDQEDGPAYLAACDVLASPHVPNPDGSEFFGSPTKLFEYMSMGRGIVASGLGQISEIIENRKTGLLVTPGLVSELADAICTLAMNIHLRTELGANARRQAVSRHTWRAHTERIIDHVRGVLQ